VWFYNCDAADNINLDDVVFPLTDLELCGIFTTMEKVPRIKKVSEEPNSYTEEGEILDTYIVCSW
jgi:hypothetical protein